MLYLAQYEKDQAGIDKFFTVYFGVMIAAQNLGDMFNGIEELNEARSAAVPVFALMERVPVIDSLATNGLKLRNITGNIHFKDINFAYPTRKDLQVSSI